MAPRFYSKEWLEAVIEKANNDKEYLKKANGLTATFMFIVLDCPDGNDVKVLLTWKKGKVVKYAYETKPAPAGFRIGGDEPWNEKICLVKTESSYDTFKKLQTKELKPFDALTQGVYKNDGKLMKAMSLMKYTTAFSDLQATVDCEY